jgi:hypothetical protein
MKFRTKLIKECIPVGMTRSHTKFLWFPKKLPIGPAAITEEYRWWEEVTIKQVRQQGSLTSYSDDYWQDLYFVDR